MNSLKILSSNAECIVYSEALADINCEQLELIKSPNKSVTVSKDDRYTTINIDSIKEKEEFLNLFSDSYQKVEIIKDRILETTETHIQKFFVSYPDETSEMVDVIIKDIYVDRIRGESKRDIKSARKKMYRKDFYEAFGKENAFIGEKTLLLEN